MVKTIEREVSNMKTIAWDVFIASIFKESQVGRSLRWTKDVNIKRFREAAFESTKKLMKLIDRGAITNEAIRKEIKAISNKTGASIGHSQKIINTSLKGYCLLLAKPTSIIKRLDCPLDSTTMSNNQKIYTVDWKAYKNWQDKFEKENHGIRLLRDMEYDKNRLHNFFNPKIL